MSVNAIRIISALLALFYGFTVFKNLCIFQNVSFQIHLQILNILLIIAALSALGTAALKDWARKLLILANVAIFFFFTATALYLIPMQNPSFYVGAFIFLSIIVCLYFNQLKVKLAIMGPAAQLRKSILLVDDDPAILKTLKSALLSSGYSVLTAASGEKGLQVAKNQKPDLILLDVLLPGIKGREVCIKLKNAPETSRIPVMFLTAKDSPDDVEAEIKAGGLAHITKPVNTSKLLEEIRKAIGSS